MATERLLMRNIREILRLKWTLRRSHRDTARSLGISPGAVASVISRATAIGLIWDALADLTDEALEQRLYGPKVTGRPARPLPDPAWIHTELRRAGVTASEIAPVQPMSLVASAQDSDPLQLNLVQ